MYKKTLAMLCFVTGPFAYGTEIAQVVPSDWQVVTDTKQVVITTLKQTSYRFDSIDVNQKEDGLSIQFSHIKVNANASDSLPYLVRWLEWLQEIEGVEINATMNYTVSANNAIVTINYDHHPVAEIQLVGEPIKLDLEKPQQAFLTFLATPIQLKIKADIVDWFKHLLEAQGIHLPTLQALTLAWDSGNAHPAISLIGKCDDQPSCIDMQFMFSNASLGDATYSDYLVKTNQHSPSVSDSGFKVDDIHLNVELPMQLSSSFLASVFGEIGQYIHNQEDHLDGQFVAKLSNQDDSLLLNMGYYAKEYSNFELSLLVSSFSNDILSNLDQSFIDAITFKVDGSQAMNSLMTEVTGLPTKYQRNVRKSLSKSYLSQSVTESGSLSKAYNYAMSRYVLDPQSITIDLSADHTVTMGDFASFVYGYYLASQPQQMLLDFVQKNYTYKFIVNGALVESPSR